MHMYYPKWMYKNAYINEEGKSPQEVYFEVYFEKTSKYLHYPT